MPDGGNSTPAAPLREDEEVLHRFHADRAAYLRDNAWMAAIAMAGGMLVLWLMGNPHVWTGAVGGLAAIGLRGWYMASEELAARWDLTDRRLLGPGGRVVRLAEIVKLRTLASTVQVVTAAGDKHLLKYQGDRDETLRRLRAAVARAGGQAE
ncbi:hypothetical protein P1J78_09975 [Psychromarinibacter sp. C21-152]|uniref:Uncharacterized protein n=1 Tax=Psychromarinibacter sediminicola TaxID=3033385 RepID=A0AAE3T8A1_9RHOB|nr:hypothetical protein [Psychromarinibacter sediminicola]MDF0601057.1 hypothetical protein [Psychromarinibacter sediminicola]